MLELLAAPADTDLRATVNDMLTHLLDDLADMPPLFEPLSFRQVGVNAIAELSLRWRCHPRLPRPDAVATGILELLYHHERIRSNRILAALPFARDTIYRRLRSLARLRVIDRYPKAPRGYSAPWLRNLELLVEGERRLA